MLKLVKILKLWTHRPMIYQKALPSQCLDNKEIITPQTLHPQLTTQAATIPPPCLAPSSLRT